MIDEASARAVPDAPLAEIDDTLASYELIDAARLENVSLSRRHERKGLVEASSVAGLLAQLRADHLLVPVAGGRVATYGTLYFDGPRDELYRDHHRGVLPRFKVRVRQHEERALAYLEVKAKDASGVGWKARRERPLGFTPIDDEERAFIREACPDHTLLGGAATLRPALFVRFERIMLVGRDERSRVTIDLDLSLETRERRVALPGLAVVEVKTPSASRPGFLTAASESAGFSKYCMGVSLLARHLPSHRFRSKAKRIEKLTGVVLGPSTFGSWNDSLGTGG